MPAVITIPTDVQVGTYSVFNQPVGQPSKNTGMNISVTASYVKAYTTTPQLGMMFYQL
jgi:hypothetical protein